MTPLEGRVWRRVMAEQAQRDRAWRARQVAEAEAEQRDRDACAAELVERVIRGGGAYLPGVDA